MTSEVTLMGYVSAIWLTSIEGTGHLISERYTQGSIWRRRPWTALIAKVSKSLKMGRIACKTGVNAKIISVNPATNASVNNGNAHGAFTQTDCDRDLGDQDARRRNGSTGK